MTDPQHISRLLAIMARLRDPVAGCPWDLQQDFATIAPYTIEEAYEVADAIDRNDLPALKDELGDLLLQVVFHAQMAQEAGQFGFGDVVQAISDKMVRRHPHVFDAQGRASAAVGRMPGAAPDPLTRVIASLEDAETQTRAWEEHKKREREAVSDDRSALAGIARGLPEWQRATKLQKRAAALGFDWPGPDPVIAKLHEEIEEVRVEFAALATDPDRDAVRDRLEDEIGDVLFVCVNLARHAKVDFGAALRRANHKFERRFRRMEQLAAQDGIDLAQQPLQAQDAYWDRAKAEERK
jgi:nucleoside triphosphate diphosphatase